MSTILIIDDEKNTSQALTDGLAKDGYEFFIAETGKKALDILGSEKIDLILTDLVMPGIDGIAILKKAKTIQPAASVVLLTGHGSIETAVEAIKEGAYDYVTKPVSMSQIRRVVEKALETRDLLLENKRLKNELRGRFAFANIIGTSDAMKEILKTVEQIAPTRSTVLLMGESGTGKEIVAQAIHYCSPRADGPFVKVSCAALPESLLESELFGYERGAFTGATKLKQGRFELADGGTLFLDEVGEMNPSIQVKLLRVLQEGEFERIGGTRTLKVDVRIIAASNRNLFKAVVEKKFREDLYYRLNVIALELPPLRERKEDISLLVHHFIGKYNEETGKSVRGIIPKALKVLEKYSWPGNIRELENVIERAVVMTRTDWINVEDLPESLQEAYNMNEDKISLYIIRLLQEAYNTNNSENSYIFDDEVCSLEEMKEIIIQKALKRCNGDKKVAADLLGIGVATLYRKLKEAKN